MSNIWDVKCSYGNGYLILSFVDLFQNIVFDGRKIKIYGVFL